MIENIYERNGDKMGKKYLTILEVSQKQAFIFSSNKLKDNVTNSAIIAWVTDPDFFEKVIQNKDIFDKEQNIVYFGGGHTVLVFENYYKARSFVQTITYSVKWEYEDLELFAKILECENEVTNEDLKKLSQELEVKKSKRIAAFHQGSFGIENLKKSAEWKMPEKEKELEEKLMPSGFEKALEFEKLGGSKDESNFIAIVHIDGNSMGKRVEDLRRSMDGEPWNEYRNALKCFSDSIDADFKKSYREMVDEVADHLMKGHLSELDLESGNFPVRRIITAGDDICFVTEGRIGIECANIFIKKLADKKNKQDGKKYAACAGVAIVHQKYPFYRAYELAEELCSNAKKFIANTGGMEASAFVSAIDWHIEYGEMKEGLEETRKMYRTTDGNQLELRPYIVLDSEKKIPETIRNYSNFKRLITKLRNGEIAYARGKIKELRQYLKQGEKQAEYYLKTNLIHELVQDVYKEINPKEAIIKGEGLERKIFAETEDGKKRSLFYDAIEIIDTFIDLEQK